MSAIDITKPVSGNPTTQSVRDNFAAAAAEIDALDSAVTTLQGSVSGFDSHLTDTNNPHAVTKTQIGLGNVDNTSDVNKPISTATQAALDAKQNTLTNSDGLSEGTTNLYFTNSRVISTLLAGLSTATNAVITASDTILSALGKLQKQVSDNLTALVNHTGNTNNPHSVTKTQVGLSNVDNTSDLNKPISTATQTALNSKADSSALSAHVVDTGNPHSTTAAQIGAAPTSRTIATTAPLTGGGDLSADRTLAISAATSLAAGSMSAADKTKLDAITGTNTGDETGSRIATLLHAASTKTTLVDADEVNGTDSAASFGLIRTTWANVRAYLLSYFAPKGAVTTSGVTMSTARLLGRNTASTGAIEEITLGTNLSFSGTTLNATGGSPAGSGSELQYRNAGAFGAVTDSSVSGGQVTLGDTLTLTTGAMVSGVANGATAVGFNRNTTNTFSTSGAILDRVQNNGTTVWSIDKDGTISLAAASNALRPGIVASDAATTGISMGSAGGNPAVWIYANNTLVAKANNNTFSCYRLGLGLAGNINNFTAGLWSPSSGLVNVTDGGTTNLRDLKARSLISSGGTITLSNYTVATLPTAASNTHAIVAVTDGNASPTYRGAVTGGGSTKGVVYCDGSSWMWH